MLKIQAVTSLPGFSRQPSSNTCIDPRAVHLLLPWRRAQMLLTNFIRLFGFLSYPVGFMSKYQMLRARVSGSKKKTLSYQDLTNASAIFESNAAFYKLFPQNILVETTRKTQDY